MCGPAACGPPSFLMGYCSATRQNEIFCGFGHDSSLGTSRACLCRGYLPAVAPKIGPGLWYGFVVNTMEPVGLSQLLVGWRLCMQTPIYSLKLGSNPYFWFSWVSPQP